MKNKALIIMAAAIVLLVGGVIFVKSVMPPQVRTLVLAESPDQQITVAQDGTELRYCGTSNGVDSYADEAGNSYTFTRNGKLFWFSADSKTISEKRNTVAKEVNESFISGAAFAAGRCLFGDAMDGFECIQCYDGGDSWEAHFVMKIGFADAAYFDATGLKDGTIIHCDLSHYYGFADKLDPKLLDGVTEQQVRDFAAAEINGKHPDAKKFEIQKYYLEKKNGKTYIGIKAVMQDEHGDGYGNTFYYPL